MGSVVSTNSSRTHGTQVVDPVVVTVWSFKLKSCSWNTQVVDPVVGTVLCTGTQVVCLSTQVVDPVVLGGRNWVNILVLTLIFVIFVETSL